MNIQLTEADNEFYLGLYRNAVALYQPRIEKRTGVSLGKISVWDYRHIDQHVLNDLEWRASPWPVSFVRRIVFGSKIQQYAMSLRSSFDERANRCSASYFNNGIYVSFSGDIRQHEEYLAMTAVHELSHALWEKIAGKCLHDSWPRTKADQEKFTLLTEGFATYADHVWFFDLYSPSVKKVIPHIRMNPLSVYTQGLRRVEELVKEFGSQVLLELPKQWKRL